MKIDMTMLESLYRQRRFSHRWPSPMLVAAAEGSGYE